MNFSLTEDELLEICTTLSTPNIRVEISPNWSSQEKNHQEELHTRRDFLLREFGGSCSISHTMGMGGLVHVPEGEKVHFGFDIELDSRVRESIIKRVCATNSEVEEAYSSSSLWVAKESSFKALIKLQQPKVISDLEIGGWSMLHSHFETFKLVNLTKFGAFGGRGCVLKKNPFSLGFFACLGS